MNNVKCPQCGNENIGYLNNVNDNEYYGLVKINGVNGEKIVDTSKTIHLNVFNCLDCNAIFFKRGAKITRD